MRSLGFWQPFATLMFYGKIETRSWPTDYRGPVLFVTTKTPLYQQPLDRTRGIVFGRHHQTEINAIRMDMERRVAHPTDRLNGYAIGVGDLIDCRWATDDDKTFYCHSGVFAHVYANIRRIKPFPHRAPQKWGIVPATIEEQLIFL